MTSREVTRCSILLRKTRPIWWAIFPMCKSQCSTFRDIFSASVLPWKLSCTTPMASRKGWRFLRRGWEGPSMVCTTQKSWESPPDIGQGGSGKDKVVCGEQHTNKGKKAISWKYGSELRAVDIFWYTNATSSLTIPVWHVQPWRCYCTEHPLWAGRV